MSTATGVEQKAVKVSMAPPKRLMQASRFMSSKNRYDWDVWALATDAVTALLEDGWQIVGVVVEWGTSQPLTASMREAAARSLTQCDPGICQYGETSGAPGKGWTIFTLERDG